MKRGVFLGLTCLAFLLGTVGIMLIHPSMLFELILVLLFSVCFFLLFLLSVVSERVNGKMTYEGTSYGLHFVLTLIAVITVVVFSIFEGFIMPFMITGMLLSVAFNDRLAVSCACYLSLIYALAFRDDPFMMCSAIFLSVSGCMAVSFVKENEGVKKVGIFIFTTCYSGICTAIFLKMRNGMFEIKDYIDISVCALVTGLIFALFLRALINLADREEIATFTLLTDEDYPLFVEIKKFSEEEYKHSVRTAEIARKCARACGADEGTCYLGGLYYRVGKVLGEPEITNAVSEAKKRCFPSSVIDILSEYCGIINKISTPESAIVHMADAYVSEAESLQKKEAEDGITWNAQMLVYRMLNDFSENGMYDEAKLSMNRFLKIRECLVRESVKK